MWSWYLWSSSWRGISWFKTLWPGTEVPFCPFMWFTMLKKCWRQGWVPGATQSFYFALNITLVNRKGSTFVTHFSNGIFHQDHSLPGFVTECRKSITLKARHQNFSAWASMESHAKEGFAKEKEKHYSRTNTAEVARLALKTKVSFNIQVLMNSSFKQQPKEVRFPQVIQSIKINPAAPSLQRFNMF